MWEMRSGLMWEMRSGVRWKMRFEMSWEKTSGIRCEMRFPMRWKIISGIRLEMRLSWIIMEVIDNSNDPDYYDPGVIIPWISSRWISLTYWEKPRFVFYIWTDWPLRIVEAISFSQVCLFDIIFHYIKLHCFIFLPAFSNAFLFYFYFICLCILYIKFIKYNSIQCKSIYYQLLETSNNVPSQFLHRHHIHNSQGLFTDIIYIIASVPSQTS